MLLGPQLLHEVDSKVPYQVVHVRVNIFVHFSQIFGIFHRVPQNFLGLRSLQPWLHWHISTLSFVSTFKFLIILLHCIEVIAQHWHKVIVAKYRDRSDFLDLLYLLVLHRLLVSVRVIHPRIRLVDGVISLFVYLLVY